ncbi:MAG: SGNH/GDSL hydrolase family protein [Lachnospiraceae bacterium]|nr:SGNH/GDSL hydrolase family protein [Lachnospiraceae bacterium]
MERKKLSGRKITYVMVSMLLICACLWGYAKITEVPKKQVDILFLGDSLIGQYRDETSIPYLVGEGLGMTVFNGAMGGTSMTNLNVTGNELYSKDGLSLGALTRAIAYEDFGRQQTITIREASTEHFPAVIDEMEQIDFEGLKYLLIEYGTNDYFAGVPIENPENPYDEFTFAGTLRQSLEILRKSLPDLQIILISPTYNWYLNTVENCENKDFGGGYMSGYVNAVAEIAEEYGVGYVDVYTDFYPEKAHEKALIYTEDGIHPNEDGRKKIARAIIEYIESN